MEVKVETFVEALSGEKTLINTAYLVMVALDGEDKPTEIPNLIIESEEERNEYEAAIVRRARRKMC